MNNENNCCIGNILQVICLLQEKAGKIDDIPNSCDRPFLGVINTGNSFVFNTRPVTLYSCENEEISMPYTLNGTTGTSTVFRVEKISGCCTTLRVLAPNPDTTSTLPYVGTDSFFTINSKCIGALRCLADTFVDCL